MSSSSTSTNPPSKDPSSSTNTTRGVNRRTFLKTTVAIPLVSSKVTAAEDDVVEFDSVSKTYFAALPETKRERNDAVVGCANELCSAQKSISEETLDAVVQSGESADDVIRRLQFGVRILNEYNLTNTVDESMIEAGRRDLGKATRYIPLVGSFNEFCNAACEVDQQDPETVTDFLYASLAFGIEVTLWTAGAPYKMAWDGTRFVANRTFLRFARHGCRGCIALAMSELHWAIRTSVYSHGVTEDKVEFVGKQMKELQNEAEEMDYDVNLDFSRKEIRDLVGSEGGGAVGVFPQEKEGFIDRLVPDIEIELPSLSDILE